MLNISGPSTPSCRCSRMYSVSHAQHAALALRMIYSHAQETLMSLIGATIQAPDCVIGWVHKYRNDELDAVIRKISERKPVLHKLKCVAVTWEELSKVFHQNISLPDKDKEARIIQEFARFWSRIAGDFLDGQGRYEYNSIKHGLRVRAGGFHLQVGTEVTPGVPCPPEQMKTVGSNKFGSHFYRAEAIDGVARGNIKITNSSRNWMPEQLSFRLLLMSMSMKNILSFLKVAKGASPGSQSFAWPHDLNLFDDCWNPSPGVMGASINDVLTGDDIVPQTKAQTLEAYRKRNPDSEAKA